MRNSKTLVSIAVASALGAASLPASAAGPTVYGDLAVAFVYNGKSNDTTGATGSNSSYSVNDNVSLLGVKGDAAVMEGTKFIYDFNFILNLGGGSPATHLSIVGLDGGFGTVTYGKRDNGLFLSMVDGSSYQTNWFYTPGMSSFQVSDAIKFVSKASGGFQYGVQAFDIGKSGTSGESKTNYTFAGTFTKGDLTFAAGYTSYADHADGDNLGSASSDTNQFGEGQNMFSGLALKSTLGVSAAYKSGKIGVVAAYDMRKPTDTFYTPASYDFTTSTYTAGSSAAQNDKTINTLMLTGSYAYTEKTTFVANYSSTSQSDSGSIAGKKGTIITLMASYAPAPALLYSIELQSSNEDANVSGITATSGLSTGAGSTSSTAIAVGATYNF